MNNILSRIFFLLLLLTTFFQEAFSQTIYRKIGNYKVYYGWAHNYPQDWMILRRFDNEGRNYLLMVNPQTLETRIDEPKDYQVKPMTMEEAMTVWLGRQPATKAAD